MTDDNQPVSGMLDFSNPDLQALLLTYRHVGELIRSNATEEQWRTLTEVLADEHTASELANMLVGSCVVHLRSLTLPDDPPR